MRQQRSLTSSRSITEKVRGPKLLQVPRTLGHGRRPRPDAGHHSDKASRITMSPPTSRGPNPIVLVPAVGGGIWLPSACSQSSVSAIVEAYTVLRDVATRKKYDEQGLAGLGPRFSHLKHYVKQRQEAAEGEVHEQGLRDDSNSSSRGVKAQVPGAEHAQPSPAQPSPAQPSPAQPSPAQPSPAQPSPAQPSPAQPSPAQPSPAQPSPAQPSPAQPSPAQPSPAQPSPAQPSPAQPSPAQPSPAQPSPAQPSPAQPSPGPIFHGCGAGAASSSAPLAPGLEEVGREGWAPGRQRGIRARGRDVVAVLGLELREAVTGVEKLVSTCILGTCLACQGWGSDTSSSPASADWQRGVQLCEVCRGSGEILKTVWQPSGMRVGKLDTCPACSGRGTQPLPPCKKCGGEGRIRTRRRVAVRVPAGVTQRSRLRLPGLGDAGRAGGEAGDLMLRFHVHMSEDMERRGLDMHTRLPLSLWDALLGTSLEVATARGLRILDVPPGVQHGDTLQMQHAGVANSERGVMSYGHHYFELHLVVPDSASLTPDALTALDGLRRLREKHRHSEGEAGAAEASAVGRS
ncbi:hypothetical protein QJQ45_000132 [Haematococcus lacustris]|nr:hypothetical protein QJQ45_000132 [Haematococcus lacustris]